MTTHPAIDRLAETTRSVRSEELTVADVTHVLGRVDRKAIDELIRSGQIEALACASHGRGKKDTLGREVRNRYSIAAAAVLTYLVRSTLGDKAVILEAIRTRFPHHAALCEKVASGCLPAAAAFLPTAPLPENVICIRSGKRGSKPTQPADHPDQLFLFPTQATA